MSIVEGEVAPKAAKSSLSSHARTSTRWTASSLWTPLPGGGYLESPPHSIRTRLWKLHSETSDWEEVLAVSNAIASKREEIEACKPATLRRAAGDRLRALTAELNDWTWPARPPHGRPTPRVGRP